MEQTYGERLKALREDRGLTQEQLAKKSGMDVYVIKWVESGILDPGMGRTARLADALGVNPTYLAGFTPPGGCGSGAGGSFASERPEPPPKGHGCP